MKAFILGAGLGTRLRPLTERLPKPLVPLFGRPLVERALHACWAAGLSEIAINTHHRHEMWLDEHWGILSCGGGLRSPIQRSSPLETEVPLHAGTVRLFHEPILLETGGGLRNIHRWWGNDSLLIHNGDVLATFSLPDLIAHHRRQGCVATLALRSEGKEQHIALDPSASRVIDIRQRLNRACGTHVFTGIYCVEPEFFDELPQETVAPVLPALIQLAARGELAAAVMDEGDWRDLGDRDSYLAAHRHPHSQRDSVIDATAQIHPTAMVMRSVIGAHSVLEANVVIEDSVLWPGSHIASDTKLSRCIICGNDSISGHWTNRDG